MKKRQRKTIKIKSKKLEQELDTRAKFLWALTNEEHINDKKVKCSFERAVGTTVSTKKGMKKVKFLEKCYRQLRHKKVPVAAIIFTLITAAPVVGYFLLKEPLYKIGMIIAASIIGAVTLFIWLSYIIMMIRKKKLLKYCVDTSATFALAPISTNQQNPDAPQALIPDDLVEAYLQGSENNIGK